MKKFLFRKEKEETFRSNWNFSYFDYGDPNFQIEATRYVPKDAFPSKLPEALEVDTENPNTLLLCYPHDPDEVSRCFSKKYAF